MKFKIYGVSDDRVVVRGVGHTFEDEFGSYQQKAILSFSDGTIIYGLYAPNKTACWRFNVVKYGSAHTSQTQRGEEEGKGEDRHAPNYSDVFTIEHEDPNFSFQFTRVPK